MAHGKVNGFVPILAIACFATGCSTTASSKATLAAVGSAPAGSFTPALATLTVGIVLGFEAHVDGATAVTATVDDPSVVAVAPTVQGSQFVLIGLAAGRTTLRVYENRNEQASIPVQVTAQLP